MALINARAAMPLGSAIGVRLERGETLFTSPRANVEP